MVVIMKQTSNKSLFSLLFQTLALFGLVFLMFFTNTDVIHAQASGAMLLQPNQVFVSGDYAYVVSNNSHALEIIDVSNPALPKHTSSIVHGEGGAILHTPSSVFVSDAYAYVTSFFGNALEIVDISDPTNPMHVSSLVHGEGGSQFIRPVYVQVVGNYAYVVVRGSRNISIINISNPSAPAYVGAIFLSPTTVPTSLFVSENYLYLTSHALGFDDGSLNIYDVTDPVLPVFKGSIYNGSDGARISNPTSVHVDEGYAYITSAAIPYALEIVDVSDTTNPIHKGAIVDGEGGASLFFPISVFVSGDYAYIASFVGNTLEIVDVSDPANPTHKGKFYYEGELSYPNSVFVVGNYAYVTLHLENALDIIDVSNPTNPVRKSKISNGELVGTPTPTDECMENCYSNVLFLPGVMGSRLYEQNGLTEKELWVSRSDANHTRLSLNNQGKSANSIYTKNDTQRPAGDGDETGVMDDIYSFNIYQSFLDDLEKWKTDDKIIEDYAFIPYDWRLSLDDVITNGVADVDGKLAYNTSQDFSESFILKKLEELQISSRTGKVTLIGHSNGGLVIKALVQKLKDTGNPLYDQIDKIILIAVPQVGTPKAFVDLLHGNNIGPGGFIMSNERSR